MARSSAEVKQGEGEGGRLSPAGLVAAGRRGRGRREGAGQAAHREAGWEEQSRVKRLQKSQAGQGPAAQGCERCQCHGTAHFKMA